MLCCVCSPSTQAETTVGGVFWGLRFTRQSGSIDFKVASTDTTFSPGEKDWSLGEDFGYHWVTERFVFGLILDGHYHRGDGIDIE